jgi:hypothetical protein
MQQRKNRVRYETTLSGSEGKRMGFGVLERMASQHELFGLPATHFTAFFLDAAKTEKLFQRRWDECQDVPPGRHAAPWTVEQDLPFAALLESLGLTSERVVDAARAVLPGTAPRNYADKRQSPRAKRPRLALASIRPVRAFSTQTSGNFHVRPPANSKDTRHINEMMLTLI